jgi:O-methyltransferase
MLSYFQKIKNQIQYKLISKSNQTSNDNKISKQEANEAHKNPNEHEKILSYSTYSPWNLDCEFLQEYSKIAGCTLVDKYRCFELWQLVEQCSKLDSGSIIEIGVWRGGTGALMAKKAKLSNIVEKVYLCDTFHGVVKAGINDSSYEGGEHSDTNRENVENLLYNQMLLDNIEILEGIFPEETGEKIQDLKFRLCHIDVDVYQSAKDIVDWIWDKMVLGGIIIFDDYGFSTCDGITKYVNEQFSANGKLCLYNINGHAIIIKI